MIWTPMSLWFREARPATRYQTDSARAWGSIEEPKRLEHLRLDRAPRYLGGAPIGSPLFREPAVPHLAAFIEPNESGHRVQITSNVGDDLNDLRWHGAPPVLLGWPMLTRSFWRAGSREPVDISGVSSCPASISRRSPRSEPGPRTS